MQTVAIIFLLAAIIVLICVICKMKKSLDLWQSQAVEKSMMLDNALIDKRLVVKEKAQLEVELNAALEVAEKKDTHIAALEAEVEHLKTVIAAKEQQEEPPRCENAAVTWTLDRLPAGKTNTYRCMDFRTITDKSSSQYLLQNEEFTFTEAETGLRFSIIDGKKYYHAALATAYGIDIGNTWRVTLDTGYTLNVIHAEYKHDIKKPRADDFGDPDVNYAGDQTTSVIEFVNDMTVMPRELRGLGGMFSEDFGGKAGVLGNIVEMNPTGRKWRNVG